jgi:HSP20 family molecular chaperone IbpA
MNIIKNKKLLKGISQQIDQLNTLSGGVSMAHMAVDRKEDKMIVTVTAPGVSAEAMHVMVEFNRLIVYGLLPQTMESNLAQPALSLPLFSQVVKIPFQVDTTQISAGYNNGRLQVVLPYSQNRLQKAREIEIERF